MTIGIYHIHLLSTTRCPTKYPSSRDVMTLRLWLMSIFSLVQQHEACTSTEKMILVRLLRHGSTCGSLLSHPHFHSIVSRLTIHERPTFVSFTYSMPLQCASRHL